MRAARVLLILSLLVLIGLFLIHISNDTSKAQSTFFTAPRIQKIAGFHITGYPFHHDSWPSQWGINSPTEGRQNEFVSEIDVRVHHSVRSDNFVEVSVKGESEAEVDAFIETLQRDFTSVYRGYEHEDDPWWIDHGQVYEVVDPLDDTWNWRQRYTWLLAGNAVVCVVLLLVLRRAGKRPSEPTVSQA